MKPPPSQTPETRTQAETHPPGRSLDGVGRVQTMLETHPPGRSLDGEGQVPPAQTVTENAVPDEPIVALIAAANTLPEDADGTIPADDILPAGVEYKLLRQLGTGSYGEVYEAEAPGGVRVAVKRILRDMNHPASRGELESLEAIKRVSHPFLLQTQAYWVCRDRLVVVMELADGTLADWITKCKARGLPGVPPAELIPYFIQVGEALDYLHSRNVSHRDIKPENLLHLKGYAKVADFGLARVHEHTQTTVKQMIGTPLYMAPEVWRNRVSLHSDQYSLAATYVAARLGRPLFDSSVLMDLALDHRDKEPDLDPLPPDEQRVLKTALAKSPDDRYPNCSAFVAALRDAVLPRPAPPVRSRVPVVVAAVAGLCALAAAVAFSLRPVPPGPRPADVLWCPPGWEPVAEAGRVTTDDGRTFHKQLALMIGGERVVAVAISPTRSNNPPLFYMLRDKVTNRVFAAVWDNADPGSLVSLFRRNFEDRVADLLPEKWRDIEDLRVGFGIARPDPEAPVINVTFPEAALVAESLGGSLPTGEQWLKAVGHRDGPPDPASLPPGEPALGLFNGPWPVTRPTPDVSVHGIHQLTSNGLEWTREDSDGKAIRPFEPPPLGARMFVVGQSWDAATPLTFAGMTQKRTFPWANAEDGIGFRVVLEPK